MYNLICDEKFYPYFLINTPIIKVYDQVCSLNQLINCFFICYILFLYIYTDNSFFLNMFLKLIGKKLQRF